MNINLQQLKEIAKAGYGGELRNKDWQAEYITDAKNESNGSILKYRYISNGQSDEYTAFGVFVMTDYVRFVCTSPYFNHLAAIRKMEELGLIEK